MKRKILTVLLFILFALPIPVALLGFGMCFLWLLSAFMRGCTLIEAFMAILGILLGASYIFTYVFALLKTRAEQRISLKTFLPLFHCILALLFLFSLKPADRYISSSKEYFGFAKKEYLVVYEQDTHSGFMGDGTYSLILDCSDNKEKALKTVQNWNRLPLSENLNLIMYGGEKDGTEYLYNLAGEAHMPKITNGYYVFCDRSKESKDPADDSELFKRYSYNFSIAMYDCDTDKMYYFEFDT